MFCLIILIEFGILSLAETESAYSCYCTGNFIAQFCSYLSACFNKSVLYKLPHIPILYRGRGGSAV